MEDKATTSLEALKDVFWWAFQVRAEGLFRLGEGGWQEWREEFHWRLGLCSRVLIVFGCWICSYFLFFFSPFFSSYHISPDYLSCATFREYSQALAGSVSTSVACF